MKSDSKHYFQFIDGLRCIAVLFVFFFHSGIKTFSGGFIGVDIFFVISGFLMTRILTAQEPTFASFGIFLIGRVRRIFPAYIVMLIIVSVIACIVLFPDDLLKLVPGLVSATVFLSNLVFRAQANYFDQDQIWNPILHTWSLGVEWQFYIVFPLVLIAARRGAVSRWMLLSAIGAASFIWSVIGAYGWHASPTAAFFLLPARIWEFLAGTLVAATPALPPKQKGLAEALCLLGLATLFGCAFLYDTKTVFPGPGALLPCAGTALIIYCGGSRPTAVTRLLSLPPLRLIGQASYSIYLWHWPLIVFYKYRFVADESDQSSFATIVIIVAAIVLGLVSWRYVERPFRQRATFSGSEGSEKRRLSLAGATAAIPILAAGLIFTTHGLPARFSNDVIETFAAKQDSGKFRDCAEHGDLCRLGRDDVKPTFVLLGDSHAAAIADGIDEKARDLGKAGILLSAHGCGPFLDVEATWPPARAVCRQTQERIPLLLDEIKPDQVILHSIWESYNGLAFESEFDEMLRFLHGRGLKVTVISDTPGARANVPFALARREAFGLRTKPEISLERYLATNGVLTETLRHTSEKYGFRFVDLGLSICGSGTCPITAEGKPLYFDTHHLTGFGSRYVIEKNGDWFD